MTLFQEAGVTLKVLLPIDGSAAGDGVVFHAARFLRPAAVEMILLMVRGPRAGSEPTAWPADDPQGHLDWLRSQVEHPQLVISTSLISGDPAVQIPGWLERLRPDFVALASDGWRDQSRLIHRELALELLAVSSTPLLLCNRRVLECSLPSGPVQRILVPLGGEPSDHLLGLVEEVTLAHGCPATLVGAAPDPAEAKPVQSGTPRWRGRSVPRREALLTLEPPRLRLQACGIGVRTLPAVRGVTQTLLDTSDPRDVIVTEIQRRSRWWSVPRTPPVMHLLRHAPCPVLVRGRSA